MLNLYVYFSLNAVTTGDDLITYGKMLMTSDISSLKVGTIIADKI